VCSRHRSPSPCGLCSSGRHQGDWVFEARRTSRSVRILRSGEAGTLRRTVAATVMRRCGHLPALAQARPVAVTVPLGHLMFQTERWNETICMADLSAQSPSLTITMRVLFERTTSRRLGFEARRTSPLRSDFEVGRGGDPSPDSRRYRYAALRAFSGTCRSAPGSGDCLVRPPDAPNKAVERSDSYGRPKGAVAIAHHHYAGSVRVDDIKATGFLRPDG